MQKEMFRRCVLLACCVYAVWAAQLAGNNVVTDEHGDVYSIEQTERKTGGMEMTIKDSQGVNVLRVLNVEGVHIEIPSDRKVCIIRDVLNELEAAKCFEEVPYTDKVPDAVRSLCAGMEIIKARSLKDCKEDPVMTSKYTIARVADAKYPWGLCCRWRRYPGWPCWGRYGTFPLYCPMPWSWRWIWVRHCVWGYTYPIW
ncbi:uncharacterized protein LOC128226187 isoform X2 [Mya arenaria]|uniref:uncharacterized protein LOC128226187 isoform X2 n=1 Tax=Mya arenaria TaxID=6604 RepID=UPI0022E20C6C|nr:uncharacterized protein LOC128226187 isoform X2 [Mya arenaria]